MKFMGYKRPNGRVGVRNHLLIMPSVVCANDVAMRIAVQLEGAVSVPHEHGCCHLPDDAAQVRRTLAGFASNPNVAACIVVGLGCETILAQTLAEDIAKNGVEVACVVIQDEGGSINAVAKGLKLGREMLSKISELQREECDASELILGLECGGSDAWSGLAGNPVAGGASDLLIEHGGTSILSETQEVIGAEHILARRASDPAVAEKLLGMVRRAEQGALSHGFDIRLANPTPGNREGGLTTLEEKSLGCIFKAGFTAPLNEALDYAERPTKKGLVFMDTPGQDVESITGMVAGGAQIIIFTTGRGTCVGSPIAPVVKICTNSPTFEKMRDNMDFNAGPVVEGQAGIKELGQALFEEIIRVCNGKTTKAEQLGFGGFAINRIGPTQ